MIFHETPLPGAVLIEMERVADERGFFARTFCAEAFAERGLETQFVQCGTSFNEREGTLRGLHYQKSPHEEAKLVRCTQGAIYDVIVDLRKGSATFGQWFAAELSGDNGAMMYVPKGFAHGFQTLTDSAEVAYQISEPYRAGSAGGVRWDDPALAIDWPEAARRIMSPRDRDLPFMDDLE